MKILSLFILFLATISLQAQVTFKIIGLPASTPPNATIYIAGSFNEWNPGNPSHLLVNNADGKPEITLPAGTGTFEFKFTRGNWESCEGSSNGSQISNRTFTYGNGQTIDINIAGWEDMDGGGSGNSTAAPNVHIISEAFEMPQLNRTRRIWIYLPPDYDTTTKSYPVLYMHDGQNIFDIKTSYAGEWEVDETLNNLFYQKYEVPIVVAIDNGGSNRIAEYTPWRHPTYGGGDGEKYVAFIVETLKPYIDAHFRTKTGANSTGIMGSSLGGLISHYAMVTYPEIFSKAGLFSPSYWFSDTVNTYTAANFNPANIRAYMMCGNNEGDPDMVPDMQEMANLLTDQGLSSTNIQVKVIAGGQHNEKLWREQFAETVKWLFQLTQDIPETDKPVKIGYFYPNPASDKLFFMKGLTNEWPYHIDFIAESGVLVKSIDEYIIFPLKIDDLKQGNYIIQASFNQSSINQMIIKQ